MEMPPGRPVSISEGRRLHMLIHSQKSKRLLTRFLFVLVVIAVTAAILVPVAFAASWSASATTVCTGGYSSLYWAGYNVWDWGRTTAWLWTYIGSSWVQNGESDSGQYFGATANLNPLAWAWIYYHNKYYQASGGSVASFFQGQQNRYGSVVGCQ